VPIGAGRVAAAGSGRARVVAVSIEDRRSKVREQETERLTADRVRYLFGKRLREYAKEELGTFQLITDVYGGFSYTDELSKFMEKVLGFSRSTAASTHSCKA